MQLDNDGSMLLYVLVIAWVAVKFGIKYHECCNTFLRQQEWYLSQISLPPMLFHVNTILILWLPSNSC